MSNPDEPYTLWTSTAPADLSHLDGVTSEQIEEAARSIDWQQVEKEIAERLAPFQTPVTAETMRRWVR